MIALLLLAAGAFLSPTTAAFSRTTVHRPRAVSVPHPTGRRPRPPTRGALPLAPTSRSRASRQPRSERVPVSSTALAASPPSLASLVSPGDHWGNIAVLSCAASLAQLLGKSTAPGRLLGAPVTAMALTFVLSSVGWPPGRSTLLPPGGSPASAFLQATALTLATPLLLLGTSLRGRALRQCGALLASFAVAALGTLLGAVLAMSLPIQRTLVAALPHGDGLKIAAALLAKNIGGGINYMAVCACLRVAPESVAAGLCVDNVMALVYFPLVSVLASRHGDVVAGGGAGAGGAEEAEEAKEAEEDGDATTPVEALSHAFTLAAVLTAAGRCLNSQLQRVPALLGRQAASGAGPPDLSLPLTTLLAVAFSTCYPPDAFLSPTSSRRGERRSNAVAAAGETLGTACLYLFFATAGAPGWRLKGSVQRAFPAIASFLLVLYGVHGAVLWGTRALVDRAGGGEGGAGGGVWREAAAPQRLLVASSAAIGGPATAAALAKSFGWRSLLTPSLLVGNVGYALATFVGLLFYGVYR